MLPKIKLSIINKYRGKIREKAITKTKARIALAGKNVSGYSKDQLEIIVKEEEDRIIEDLKKSALYAVIVFLGIGSL